MPVGGMIIPEYPQAPLQRHPRRIAGDQDHGLLLVLWRVRVGLTHENEYLATGICRARRPPLVSVYDILIAISNNAGPDVCGIRRGHVRLRHTKGGADLAFQQRLEPLLLLLFSAVANQDLHIPRIRRRAIEYLGCHGRTPHDFAKGCILQVGKPCPVRALW